MRGFERFFERVRERIIPLTLIFIAYLAIAQISVFLYRVVGTTPSVALAPAGVALAAVIFEGYLAWPAIALASLISALLGNPLTPAGLAMTAASTLGNTVQPLIGLLLLRRFGFNRMFFSMKDMFALLFTSLFITAITPTINFIASSATGFFLHATYPVYWTNWWIGAALSTLALTPVLIRWIARPVKERTLSRYIEIAAALAFLAVSTALLFGSPYTAFGGVSLAYVIAASLLWLAFRGGMRFTTLGILTTTIVSLLGAIFGTHPAAPVQTIGARIFNAQVFDFFFAVFFFILASLEEQRSLAQETLRVHAQKLENALDRISIEDVAKNEFIALLGHELRNPLASLLSSVEVMKIAEPSAQERRDILDTMDDRIRSMAHLLDDILDISRITTRKFTLRTERVKIYEVARRAIGAVEPLMRTQRHAFTVSFPEKRIEMDADPTRLEQVIVNLLHNAAKYTPPGGRIEFSGSFEDGCAILRVKDSGIGIPDEMKLRIFEPFVQINPKINRAGGIGVGLSLTKSLVEMHGGTIEVKSAGEGRGSEFIVRFPAKQRQEEEGEEGEEETKGRRRSPPKLGILVVDDNEEAAEGIGKLLELRGHDVRLEYAGESALDAALSLQPDVIVLDIGLPDIDGYEVARRLRRANVSAVLIALSGYGQEDDKRKAANAGFDYHLTKPVGLAELEPLIAKITRTDKGEAKPRAKVRSAL